MDAAEKPVVDPGYSAKLPRLPAGDGLKSADLRTLLDTRAAAAANRACAASSSLEVVVVVVVVAVTKGDKTRLGG